MCHNFYMCSFVNNIIKSNTILYFIDFNSIMIEIDSDDMINDERANTINYPWCTSNRSCDFKIQEIAQFALRWIMWLVEDNS